MMVMVMMMDRRGGERGTVVFWSDDDKGGRADVVPHLQCSAGLHHPIISQLSVKGAGPEADDSQGEFSVSQRERDSECVRDKVSEGVSECAVVPCAPGLSLQQRLHISPCLLLLTLLVFPHSAPISFFFFCLFSFCSPPPPSVISAFQLSEQISLCFATILSLFFSCFCSSTHIFSPGGWSERIF